MSKPIISVENLSKAYRLGRKEEVPDTLVSAVTGALTAPLKNWRRLRSLDTSGMSVDEEDILWALRDVNFEVQRGEVVGIIGRNGAGKSTLLKILSRITEPTSGRIVLRGRVSSLLEVGTGFHPELSGRDNIYMNGTILGMRKQEIDRKFDEIVEFSGVEKFLDTPVKRYSSGMTVRLAFAVAAHLEPEILIVDEVLAVGDATFQNRCITRMREVAQSGVTVLFVSHNMDLIPRLCQTAVLLRNGQVADLGKASDVTNQYLASDATTGSYQRSAVKSLPVVIESAEIIDQHDQPTNLIEYGADLRIRMNVVSDDNSDSTSFAATVCSLSGARITSSWTRESNKPIHLECGPNVIDCTFRNLTLRPNHDFTVTLWVERDGKSELIENALKFSVTPTRESLHLSPNKHQGGFVVPSDWEATVLSSKV